MPRRHRSRATALLATCVFALFPAAQAVAVPLMCTLEAYDPLIPFGLVPVDAVVPLNVAASSPYCPAPSVSVTIVTVTDPAAAPVDGTVEQSPAGLIWRPAATLEPNTTYGVHVFLDNTAYGGTTPDAEATGSFTTSSGTSPALSVPVITNAALTERASAQQRCCDTVEYCGFSNPDAVRSNCMHCWDIAYTYLPTATFDYEAAVDATLVPVSWLSIVSAPPGAAVYAPGLGTTGGTAMVHFAQAVFPLCVRVEHHSLSGVDETVSSAERCFEEVELVTLEHTTPPAPDTSRCLNPPPTGLADTDPSDDTSDTAAPSSPGHGGGCEMGRHGGTGSATLGLAAAGLVLSLRRRKQAPGRLAGADG